LQSQGTYKCPKCGSADSYEGTTLVNAGSIGVAREIGDSGAYVGASSSSTRERTVRKCRSCGEILGKKDYVPTASEREEARTSAQSNETFRWLFFFVWVIVCGYLGGKDNGGAGGLAEGFSFGKMLVGIVGGGIVACIFLALLMSDDRN